MHAGVKHTLQLSLGSLLLLSVVAVASASDLTVPPRTATAARLTGKLTLDGVLDEAAWQAAPEYSNFEWPLNAGTRPVIPPEEQTSFRVLYDDENLYFGIKCMEPKMDKLSVAAAPVHDAAMWFDDDIEIFLDPVGDRQQYYQLAINSAGTMTDLYYIEAGNTGSDWSADWKVAVHKGPDYWSLEIKLPFAALNKRPASMWADTWVFDLSRTHPSPPFYYSQFSPTEGYHDPAHWGTLGPIAVDKSRYNLSVDNPQFTLTPSGAGYQVTGTVKLQNLGTTPVAGTLAMDFQDKATSGGSVPVTLAAGATQTVDLPPGMVPDVGKYWALFTVKAQAGYLALDRMFDRTLRYTPLSLRITRPNYRNNIYATEKVDMIQGILTIGMPLEQVKGLLARVTLSSDINPPVTTETKIDMTEIPFQLPAADLPVGTYVVRAEILQPNPNKQSVEPYLVVSQAETVLRKLPPAPAVEVRVDDQGNLLIDGVPVFIRGWYGSTRYVVSAASLPDADLPHSTNYLMGSDPSESANTGLYYLAGISGTYDEAPALRDQPISDALKAAIRADIASVRNNRHVIGYYLADEPECVGLSPVWLQSAYEFIRQEDPYRFVKIVSRAPAIYMQACDVMCPHPYMSPMLEDNGTRKFGVSIRSIHDAIVEGCGANDGSKAMWCMPGIFTYGPPRGMQPTFTEARWMIYTALANGAKGIVPYIFNSYWSHLENRLALDAIFEELTFLAPAWMNRDTASEATCDNSQVDVIAKFYQPGGGDHSEVYIVAANQSYGPNQATLTVPQMAQSGFTHLLVLRENRVVPVVDGKFTDSFAGLGVHVYTTDEVLPYFQTLTQVQADIAAAYQRPIDDGNLLADSKLKWSVGDTVWPTRQDPDLVDGRLDGAAWLPVYSDRSQCVITLEKPVTFSRLVFQSPTIRDADFDLWVDGAWKTVFQWKDNYLYQFEWKGEPITTAKFRLCPVQYKTGRPSSTYPEITELGLYK